MEHSGKEIYELHAIFKGSVQGVGFRATAKSHALGLGLTGTVRNLPDGSVEIYAHGSKTRLEEFINMIREESFPQEIKEACITFFPIDTPHEDFKIID